MKRPKRIPALLLALVLAMGLITPVLAEEEGYPTTAESRSQFDIEISNCVFDEGFSADLYDWTPADEGTQDDRGNYYSDTTNGVYRLNPEAAFRLTNTAPAGTDCFLYVEMYVYEWEENMWFMYNDPYTFDAYSVVHGMWPLQLNVSAGGFLDADVADYDLYSDFTKLYPGESCTFKLNTSTREQTIVPLSDGMIARIFFLIFYPSLEFERWFWWDFMVDSSVPVGQLDEEETPNELQFKVSQSRMLDNGVGYNYTITNNTDEQMTGYYALLSYQPQKGLDEDGDEYFHAQVHTFDVDLAPGESMGSELSSYFYDLSGAKNIWITFDSKAERDSFLASPSLNYWASYYLVTSEQWLKDNFNITLLPAK